MSRYDNRATNRAVALKYEGEGAPVVVASGMGYLAERMVEVASESGVPIYEDNSLATMLSQLALGQEIPDALYQAIVEIYVYFLNFDPNDPDKARRERQALTKQAETAAQPVAPPEAEKGES
ncbi:EscU/YscU/HrcU family type III secretion system export apparatus switch protein [Oscillospiraceae bacterium 50-58]